MIDDKRMCIIIGCSKVGEWNYSKNGKVYRRPMCTFHHRIKYDKGNALFKLKECKVCEYCFWQGPCDCHRPIAGKDGGKYKRGNMRSICPNCHRLINLGLMIDKYKEI